MNRPCVRCVEWCKVHRIKAKLPPHRTVLVNGERLCGLHAVLETGIDPWYESDGFESPGIEPTRKEGY